MDIDLSERYNDGVAPAPDMAGDPVLLQRPAWQPTREELLAGRQRLLWVVGALTLLVVVCLLSSSWGS